jgi:CheY-like chemotaxis protein
MPRIMVVDDDPDLRASLVDALQLAGYDVDSAPDARSALLRMRVNKPDVLVTDVVMPRVDGWALMRSCRADPLLADLRVLVMSGAWRMHDIAQQQGVDAFLLKPFSRATMVQEVKRVLQATAEAQDPDG